MANIFSGQNPSQLYMDALSVLISKGNKCAPRGKQIREIRPVIFEYTDPTNRVTFLKGRSINPYFQLAEALWILAGRSDVNWLTDYNKSIAQFSDDGEYFNAPYGERLRYWNKSDANKYIYNPLDQLLDVYKKIKKDNDTRQAVAVIYNPIFDHADRDTKDTPCNLILAFKLRDGKLDLNVFNRSNDLHWGTFGANLCQFATIQEMMASWLGVSIGTYYQTTDSLHIYTEDYGAKETDNILNAYKSISDFNSECFIVPEIQQFRFENEPRMSSSYEGFQNILKYYFGYIDYIVRDDMTYSDKSEEHGIWERLKEEIDMAVKDEYIKMTLFAMIAYQAHKRGSRVVYKALQAMPDCSWKISCLRFICKKYRDSVEFKKLYNHYPQEMKDYIERKGE